jgi:hypothetical protein
VEWPIGFLLVVLCIAVGAILVPWVVGRRILVVALIPPFAATACWVAYESHLHTLTRVGDPVIRVDLLLIVPMIALAWLSALMSIVYKRLRKSNA